MRINHMHTEYARCHFHIGLTLNQYLYANLTLLFNLLNLPFAQSQQGVLYTMALPLI